MCYSLAFARTAEERMTPMYYTVTIQCDVDVEADSESVAIDKACLEATFGTDLYGISLVAVKYEPQKG